MIFVKNLVFEHFGRSLEARGFWKCRFFWFLVDFKILIVFGFLGGLKILAGGYGAVLVGVSIPPTQPCKEGARRPLLGSFFDPKFNF